MKKSYLSLISLLLAICFILSGCSRNNQTFESPSDLSQPQEDSSTAPKTNLMEGITANYIQLNADLLSENSLTDFSLRLFKECNKDGKNTLVSPLSVIYALSMTANGANGDTLFQMENVLGIPIDELNDYLLNYSAILPQDEKYKLNLANSIWIASDRGFNPNKDFLQVNKDYYSADVYSVKFDNKALEDINAWVNNKTDGMIPEILDKISDSAIMYLINALAFEAEWDEVYEIPQVRNGTFTLENGTTQTVEFMYSGENAYLENDNSKGFIKYFKDKKYAFVALLPNEDISLYDYIQTLDANELDELLSNPVKANVNASIPTFKTDYSAELNDMLKAMGMSKAFDSYFADFSNMGSGSGNIFISRVIHKTAIEVGPQGTKAGAATVVEMECGSALITDLKEVYLNRPFVYMLVDCETNTPFFIGTLNNVE